MSTSRPHPRPAADADTTTGSIDVAEPDAALPPTGVPARTPGPALAMTLLAGVVVAAVTSAAVLAAIPRLPVPDPTVSTANAGFTTLAIVGALAALGASAAMLTRSRLAGTLGTWASLAALVTVTLGVPLARTPLYLGGITTDQVFRNQLLNRLTDSPALSDMNYANLAPYYPSGWFWVGGRAADLLGRTGWETYKPFAIATLAVAAVVSLVLWTAVLPTVRATAVATVVTLVVLGGEGVTEPYGAFVALLGGPVLVLAWRGLASERGRGRADLLTAGVFLGLFATFYTLYFGVFALSIAAMAGLLAILGRGPGGVGVGRLVGRLLVLAVPAALIALVVWAPYVLSVVAGTPSSGVAQHYLPVIGTDLPLPMTRFTLLGAVTLVGTGWILLRGRTSSVAAALGTSVAVCLAWSVLSLVVLVLGTTLLGFRLEVPIDALLAAAGVLGVADAASVLTRRLRTPSGVAAVTGALAPLTVGVVLTGVLAVALAQAVPATLSAQVKVAYHDPLPGDPRASGNQAAAFYPEVDRILVQGLPGARRDTVVLTTDHQLLAFYPYRGFQQFTPHYANPHAHYSARNDLIRSWARAGSPQKLLATLDASPFAAPEAFYLDREGTDYGVTIAEDVFPTAPNVKYTDIRFPASLFDDPAFTVTEVGTRVVIVRNP